MFVLVGLSARKNLEMFTVLLLPTVPPRPAAMQFRVTAQVSLGAVQRASVHVYGVNGTIVSHGWIRKVNGFPAVGCLPLVSARRFGRGVLSRAGRLL